MARLHERLRLRYDKPGWITIFEVGNGTGGRQTRRADAIVMGEWPSRGYEIIGFEIKESRSDWIKDRDDPSKADAVARYCDAWWMVTQPGVIKPGELPINWGHLEASGDDKLKIKTQAKPLKPVPIDRSFCASLFRAIVNRGKADEEAYVREKLQSEYRKGIKEGESLASRQASVEIERAKKELEYVKKSMKAFEEKSGIPVNSWNGGHVGSQFKAFMEFMDSHSHISGDKVVQRLEQIRVAGLEVTRLIDEHLEKLKCCEKALEVA